VTTPANTTSRWLIRFHPRPDSDVRLVCFPHAGGSASFYHPLSMRFSPTADVIALQYPGRQDRRREACIDDIGVLADHIAEQLEPLADKPTVFYGHSMGAILAFETAWRLEQRGRRGCQSLVASGRRAPSSQRTETVHELDDDGIIAELQSLGGTDVRMIDDELLRIAMPSIRSDYKAIESYVGPPGRKVSCAIVALTGDADPLTTVAEVEAWSLHTDADFRVRVFPGGHFFITGNIVAVQDEIAREMAAARQLAIL
jgi:surfactin synthase thioesterase subunit